MDIEVIKKKLEEAEARAAKLVAEINETTEVIKAGAEKKGLLLTEAVKVNERIKTLKELLNAEKKGGEKE